MNDKKILEACVDNFIDTQKAIFLKVKRVEICSELSKGGLCPDLDLVKILIRRKVTPVVMLRTNETFSIDEEEIAIIKKKIKEYRKAGVKEYIFGWIKNNDIDFETCNEIISELKKTEKYVFHRAIDEIGDYETNLKRLINMGFSRVLTAGGKGCAMDNLDSLKNLVKNFNNKIKIVVGGKVTKENLQEIHEKTKANEFHGSRILW